VTLTKTIKVVDIRCGNKNEKVTVCQVPQGNPGNAHTICISANAVAAHLANGSYLGPCVTNPLSGTRTSDGKDLMEQSTGNFNVTASPNPTRNTFKLQIQSSSNTPISIRITDVLGRVMQFIPKVTNNGSILVGDNLTIGTFYAEVIQGNQRKVVQLVKIK
jgi:hypothetical protein